jgi:dephospho-CoA kinase
VIIIGLTGNFGAGKTLAASAFASLGAKVIDADKIARESILKGTKAYAKILRAFGRKVVAKSGEIDRRALAAAAFADKRSLGRLNAIVHPDVIDRIKAVIRGTAKNRIVVVDAALIGEAGLAGMFDAIVVVRSQRQAQIRRCVKKFGMSRADVLRRIRRQMPQEKQAAMADFIIDNVGSKRAVRPQVKRIWETIKWK